MLSYLGHICTNQNSLWVLAQPSLPSDDGCRFWIGDRRGLAAESVSGRVLSFDLSQESRIDYNCTSSTSTIAAETVVSWKALHPTILSFD